jgi:hypothetical protein
MIYSCPICKGRVLYEDAAKQSERGSVETLATNQMYCPHCEMLVNAIPAPDGVGVRGTDAGYENRGRTQEGGSNAGGSQRGDTSDEGASQWRKDPSETERNTWADKD